MAALLATTIATPSPRKRTTSSASTGRSGACIGLPSREVTDTLQGKGPMRSRFKSAAVYTATTPAIARTSSTSRDRMRAWA